MTEKDPVVEAEQAAVDHAYDCFARQVRERHTRREPYWDATDAHAGTAFIPETPPELLQVDAPLDGSLVFRRVDVCADIATGRETFYIGRRLVRSSDGDLVVISWNARMAKQWMLAQPDQPGDVLLRRELRCDDRTVVGYFDAIKERPAPAAAGNADGAGDDIGLDLPDFLLDELRRARGERMRDIVETIQREQFVLVSDERKGLLVVQGGPGTGKTAVALHRISYLLFNNVFRAEDVLVVGPHTGFLDYVGEVLPQLGTSGVTSFELARLWAGEVRGVDPLESRRVKSSARMAEVLRRAVNNRVNLKAVKAPANRTVKLAKVPKPVEIPLSLLRRFAGTEGVQLPYRVRRKRFADQLVDHLLHEQARATSERPDPDWRRDIERNRHVTRLVDLVFPDFSPQRLLRSLFRGKALRAAAANLLTEREQQAIRRTAPASEAQEPWSLEDLVCLEEIRFLMTGEVTRRYGHIVVDEAQDLTPMQARALARRCPSGSMTILGDLAQATGVHQYASWQELADQLGARSGGHLAELTIGYRVPSEVMDFVAPLAATLSPDTSFPRSVRPKSDEDPVRVLPSSPVTLVTDAVEQVRLLPATDGRRPRSIAFIVPDDRRLLRLLREQLERLAPEGLGSVVKILTTAEVKGLEFDHVIVLEPAAIVDEGPAGLNHLYVALTRCTQTLTIVHSEPLPAVLTHGPDTGNPVGSADHDEVDEQGTAVVARVTAVESAPTATVANEPPPGPDPDGFEIRLLKEVRRDRASHVHEYLRHTLIGDLYRVGRIPQVDSPLVDTSCESPQGWLLYEVLGEGGHTYPRMREGATRLKHLEFTEGEKAAYRFLVIPEQPEDPQSLEALADRHGVHVIWRTPTGWDGAHLDIALAHSG
ncbi:hypothetical protein Acsp03_66370 [Actinomadura sp. NBRC 104412]|uniref:HelD family protein n=1 Tax=Actinomadura sp. NBRC 104412 TaxID=3032203 RepID=UPI0024A3B34E|nr:AAA family ATPase [Actinomadura sp. NBRC 104412]GLZ09171.1 hypothetical protein Acsp03_66370 [Actinomadura sp. NBRC 104412]